MQTPTVHWHLHEEEANRGPLYEQTNDLLKHAEFLHSSKQESNVSLLNQPAMKNDDTINNGEAFWNWNVRLWVCLYLV